MCWVRLDDSPHHHPSTIRRCRSRAPASEAATASPKVWKLPALSRSGPKSTDEKAARPLAARLRTLFARDVGSPETPVTKCDAPTICCVVRTHKARAASLSDIPERAYGPVPPLSSAGQPLYPLRSGRGDAVTNVDQRLANICVVRFSRSRGRKFCWQSRVFLSRCSGGPKQ